MISLFSIFFFVWYSFGCTNYIVTKGASANGHNMFTYNADSFALFGALYHSPGGKHKAGEKIKIYEFDTDEYLGEIDQVPKTYNVVGNMNEVGLAIGETTWAGQHDDVLTNPNGILDYGSLIYITLQRAATAREAINTIITLCDTYGYHSTGESFTIADSEEIWVFEFIGRGPQAITPGKHQIVYVATRIPDGHVSAHANVARTRTFPLHRPEACLYSDDMLEFAREKQLTTATSLENLDFSATFCGLDASAARHCDGRVWAFYRKLFGEDYDKYLDYIYYRNDDAIRERLPLTVDLGTHAKVSLDFLEDMMGNHYEDTEFDPRKDVSGMHRASPYRTRPITFDASPDGTEEKKQEYCRERPTGVQQTGWSLVAECRPAQPGGLINGILWFGADDAACTVHVPLFPQITKIPPQFTRAHANSFLFSWDSVFWVQNLIANYAYWDWEGVFPDVQKQQQSMRRFFRSALAAAEPTALSLSFRDRHMATEYLNQLVQAWTSKLVSDQRVFFEQLFQKWFDGYEHVITPDGELVINNHPYRQSWYDLIAKELPDNKVVEPTNAQAGVATSLPASSELSQIPYASK